MLLNIGNVASYVFDDGDSKGPSMFLPNKGSFKNYVDKNSSKKEVESSRWYIKGSFLSTRRG